jgi:ubiquinone/menaquinone biosynthesis C-methylase UbiE
LQAIQEIVRVLKPGGKVALLDIQYTQEYVQALQALGWQDVKRSGLHFQMFPPVLPAFGHPLRGRCLWRGRCRDGAE